MRGELAQLGERRLCKPEVTGSNPVFSTMEMILPKTARFVVDENGDKKEIIIPVDDLNELIEDIYDAAIARARLDDEDVPWEEAKKVLRATDSEV